ncbi:MAG: DUF4349 domain-containing protein [Chloroflexi bacterium]|nr:DUF4349 domain-containing protein [Chloroflexota bacterium]
MTRWIGLAIVPLLLASAVLAACSSGDDDDDSATSASAATSLSEGSVSSGVSSAATTSAVAAAPAASEDAAPPAALAASSGTGVAGPGVAFQQVDTGRSIVYVGTMLVEVDDVRRATQQAQVAIAGLGGLVFGQHTTIEPAPRTELTFKVMPPDFTEALRRLEALGELKSQQISADDVTERVVDLESHIITSRASVERLRNFLETATGVEAVAQLESQLLARETDLEQLRGQLRTIEGQVALATIFLTLLEPAPERLEALAEIVETAYAGHDDGKRCPAADDLAVEEDEPVTVCVSLENTGDVALVEIEIRDLGLGLDDDDVVTLEGSVAGPLEPGERLLGYFLTAAELETAPVAGFSAVPVDADGEPLRIQVTADLDIFEYEVAPDDSIPTFVDGLRGSWGAVVTLARLGVLAVGVAIPFAWVVPLAVGLFLLGRRLNRLRRP